MVSEDTGRELKGSDSDREDTFWKRYGPYILLGVLIVYVILLGIGTFAELTENQTILNWWIFQ